MKINPVSQQQWKIAEVFFFLLGKKTFQACFKTVHYFSSITYYIQLHKKGHKIPRGSRGQQQANASGKS